jgi:predicted Zn-dependent protease
MLNEPKTSNRSLRTRSALLLVPAFAVGLGSCAVNPVTGKRQFSLVPESQEIQMGQQGAEEVDATMGVYDNATLNNYVDTIGKALAAQSERPNLPWSFKVVDDPLVNAFALPGGPIYVTRGLLAHMTSEAQLAAVMGHEVGHVTAKHSVQQLSKATVAQLGLVVGSAVSETFAALGQLGGAGMQLLMLRYGRDDERQADDLGFKYSINLGYQVREMPGVFTTLKRVGETSGGQTLPSWMSSHPAPDERVERLNQMIAERNPPQGKLAKDEFMAVINNMVYGPDPRHGYFEGGVFKQPEMKFQVTTPPGWKKLNTAQAVVAQQADGKAGIQLTLAKAATPAEAMQKFAATEGVANVTPVQVPLQVQGSVAQFSAKTEQAEIGGLVAFLSHGGKTFQILGLAPAASAAATEPLVRATISSFAPLTDPAALSVQPARIKVIAAPQSMTVAELAAKYPSIPAERLAIINQLNVDSRIEAGQKVKIIEGKVREDSAQ